MEQARLIIIHESPNESEQMVNALRNAGHKVRATYVESEENLTAALQGQPFDLVLTRPKVDQLDAKSVLKMIQDYGVDLPVVVLADSDDTVIVVDFLKVGAVDVVKVDELSHLMFVLSRELKNLQERRFRRLLELEVEEMQNRCQLLLGSSREPVAYIMDGMHIYANEAYVSVFGFEHAEDVECVPVMDVIFGEDQSKFKQFIKQYQSSENKTETFECRGQGNCEEPFLINMMLSSAEYEGETCTQIVISTPAEQEVGAAASGAPPLSEEQQRERHEEMKAEVQAEVQAEMQAEMQAKMQKELNAKVAQASSKDALTGIHNREYFKSQLKQIIERSEAKGEASSLYYVALDQFVDVKKNYGFEGADQLVKQVVAVLSGLLSEGAKLARFTDSDFCIWSSDGAEAQALAYAEKIKSTVEGELFEVESETVRATVSVGITFVKPNVGGAYEIISRGMKAAVSLQQDAEGNDVRIYRPPTDAQISQEQEDDAGGSSESLQKAIDNNLFKILFQPIISLRGEECEFYEVLLRLIDEEGKEISPDQFLDDASSANLSEKIDRWVILQSIKTLAARRAKGHDTNVIVNLTSQSVRDSSLIPWLGVALKAAKLPKGVVTFQVNEQDVVKNLKPTKEFVEKLVAFGCKFSISRFGLVENPFDALKHANPSYIKLDGSLIRELSKGKSQEKLTEMITQLHEGERLTIAPFVESAGILSTLWQLGAGYIQGYYLQPPMPDMSYDFSHGQ